MADQPDIPTDDFFAALGQALPPKVKRVTTPVIQGVVTMHVPDGELTGEELKDIWLEVFEAVRLVKNEAQKDLAANEDDASARELVQVSNNMLSALNPGDPRNLDELPIAAEDLGRVIVKYLESKAVAMGQAEGKLLGYKQGTINIVFEARSKLSWLMGLLRKKIK